MKRRDLLNTAVAGTAASLLLRNRGEATADGDLPFSIIDTNVSLSRWPFRRLPLDKPDALVEKLRALKTAQAWAGSFEALLHRDLRSVNGRLVETCSRFPELIPVGAINPDLPGWEKDFHQCVDEYKMHAIRLHPNYHGYALQSASMLDLLKRASDAGLIVQIAFAMEDTRMQNKLVQVPDVDLTPLPEILKRFPQAKVQILNHRNPLSLLKKLTAFPGLTCDTARVDGTDGPAKLLREAAPGKVLFGTHAPFLIPEAALIRAGESDLNDDELAALFQHNAERLKS